jgi:hypothetical protein
MFLKIEVPSPRSFSHSPNQRFDKDFSERCDLFLFLWFHLRRLERLKHYHSKVEARVREDGERETGSLSNTSTSHPLPSDVRPLRSLLSGKVTSAQLLELRHCECGTFILLKLVTSQRLRPRRTGAFVSRLSTSKHLSSTLDALVLI